MLSRPSPSSAARPSLWVDALALALAGLLLYALVRVGEEWSSPFRAAVPLALDGASLALYTVYSLARGVAALALSFLFTLVYGYAAARLPRAERVLVPLLDVLQSIPVLGFMPGVVLALVRLFPRTETGLELAAVVMLFTAQVWNLTFAFYHSLKSVPSELLDAARVYRFSWWRRFWRVEVPFATVPLVYNGMMSMAGGWFFLTINEAFVLGGRDYRLPGVGAYMAVALERGDHSAALRAVLAMTVMILAVDQLLWRPLVAWAQRYRYDETAGSGPVPTSWFLDLLRRSALLARVRSRRERGSLPPRPPRAPSPLAAPSAEPRLPSWLRRALVGAPAVALVLLALGGSLRLALLLRGLPGAQWLALLEAAGLTLLRTLGAVALGTLWALPVGVLLGTSPRWLRATQPLVQLAASFPAPMLFPLVLGALHALGVGMGLGAAVLMTLGTQWYVLFNVMAGAAGIPEDLFEAARVFRFSRWQRWTRVLLPGVFPSLVTGWLTAAGGAWNASIVAEYVRASGRLHQAHGLGALISVAAERGDFRTLAAAVLVMIALVVALNRTLWSWLQRVAARRFARTR